MATRLYHPPTCFIHGAKILGLYFTIDLLQSTVGQEQPRSLSLDPEVKVGELDVSHDWVTDGVTQQ